MKSRQTSNIKKRILLTTTVFIIAVLFWRFLPTPGRLISETIFTPLLHGETALNDLVREEPNSLDEDKVSELDYLRAENASLREVLGQPDESRIAAGVIGRPSALPYDVLMIDKGSDDGITVDTPIYVDESTVIGFVAETYQNTSLVALLSTPGFTSTAYIFGPNIYTTAVGIGGGVTRIHVPQGISLNVGDLVVLPSMSPGIYGTVSAVDSVPERAEQYGYLTTEVPISSLKVVAVGTRPLSVMEFDEARRVIDEARRDFLRINVPDDFLVEAESATSTATSTVEDLDIEASAEVDAEVNTESE